MNVEIWTKSKVGGEGGEATTHKNTNPPQSLGFNFLSVYENKKFPSAIMKKLKNGS